MSLEFSVAIPARFGASRLPGKPSTPILLNLASEKLLAVIWQLEQEMLESLDKIGSKNNFFPNATPSTVIGLLVLAGSALKLGIDGIGYGVVAGGFSFLGLSFLHA